MATEIQSVTETYQVRGESIEITAPARFDRRTQQPVFDEALDNAAVSQAFDVYRARHHFVTVDRIKRLRHQYGLGQRDFAALLGWSPTTVATYETGALPSRANNTTLLALETEPLIAKTLLQAHPHLTQQGTRTLRTALQNLENDSAQTLFADGLNRLFVATNHSVYAGYQVFDLKRLTNMVAYFADRVPQLSKTQLNKLLFYADFTYFGEATVSLSGLPYQHFPYGPVPRHYGLLYATIKHAGVIDTREHAQGDLSWETLTARQPADLTLFSADEQRVLRATVRRFKHMSAQAISTYSHAEDAWQATKNHELISYEYATTLSTVDEGRA